MMVWAWIAGGRTGELSQVVLYLGRRGAGAAARIQEWMGEPDANRAAITPSLWCRR